MQNVLNEVKSFCSSINHNPSPNANEPSKFKECYGEVYTPLELVYHMLCQLPQHILQDPYVKYLDSGAGLGNFSLVMYFILRAQNIDESYILKNMLHMAEINATNVETIQSIFTKLYPNEVNEVDKVSKNVKTNVYHIDFLKVIQNSNTENQLQPNSFDVIYGNPPYNMSGKIKTPTNNTQLKTKDGINAWVPFVRRAYDLLKVDGVLLYIIPSLWCKPDKAQIYELFTQRFQIEYLEFYTNTETNKLFASQAQTPTCIIMARKLDTPQYMWTKQTIPIYDAINSHIVSFTLSNEKAIPTKGLRIIEKLQNLILSEGSIIQYITKTSMPPLSATLIHKETITHPNKNIHSTIISNKNVEPKEVELIIKYSNMPLAYMNQKKLVLPHKMYGLPFYDISGAHGISNRDNYVLILPEVLDEFYEHYQIFLQSKLVQFILSCSRYRMMVIEKHIFDYIPQIHKMIMKNRLNSNHHTSKSHKQYTNRNKETEVGEIIKSLERLLTKEEAVYIDKYFSN